MPNRAALDVWATDALGLKFNDPTPGVDSFPNTPAAQPAQQQGAQQAAQSGGGGASTTPAPAPKA